MSALVLPTKLLPSGILPEYWYCKFDTKSQRYYYFNVITQERTLKLENVIAIPYNSLSNQNPFLKTKNILPPPSIDLDEKCIETEKIDLGYIIYYNPHTCKYNKKIK